MRVRALMAAPLTPITGAAGADALRPTPYALRTLYESMSLQHGSDAGGEPLRSATIHVVLGHMALGGSGGRSSMSATLVETRHPCRR
jgi:hypothetical protein